MAVADSHPLRPWLLGGMASLLVARPLFPSESASSGDGLTVVMLWLVLAVVWLLGAVGRPAFRIRFGATDGAVLAFFALYAVAAIWPSEERSARHALNVLWEWIGLGLCFFLARQLVTTPREVRAVIAMMLALAVAVSGYGLYQYAWEMPQTRARYAADPDRAMRESGLGFAPGTAERKLFEDRLQNKEPMGTFALTNSLAAFLAPWLVILVGIGVQAFSDGGGRGNNMIGPPTNSSNPWRVRRPQFRSWMAQAARPWAAVICSVPIVACFALTKSRSGYIAATLGLALAWLLGRTKNKPFRWRLPLAVAGILAAIVVAAMIVEGPSVLGKGLKSLGYRLQYWHASLQMIADRPWIGCGPGNFQDAYTQYKLPDAAEEIADPHNFALEIWTTAGTPVFLAFVAVLVFFGRVFLGDKQRETAVLEGAASSSSSKNLPSQLGRTPSTAIISASSSDAWRAIIVGGMAGFLLAVPLGAISVAPPGLAAVFLGVPLALGTVAILFGWIRGGALPRWLPAVGLAVLMIDLLATGGIGFPGVAMTFWLLLALGLYGDEPLALPGGMAWIALGAAAALATACYATAYRPVLACRAQLHRAEQEPAAALEHLEAAAAADPLSAEPWHLLTELRFQAWLQHPTAEHFDDFEEAEAEVLRRTPRSAAAWLMSGERFLLASSKQGQNGQPWVLDAADKAVNACQQAVLRYPNSAMCRARLAEAHEAAGDRVSFRREATVALELDRTTPHPEKKLPAALRERLVQALSGRP